MFFLRLSKFLSDAIQSLNTIYTLVVDGRKLDEQTATKDKRQLLTFIHISLNQTRQTAARIHSNDSDSDLLCVMLCCFLLFFVSPFVRQ